MSRNLKMPRTQIADLPEDKSLSMDELQLISGGWRATLLTAMGWKYKYQATGGPGPSDDYETWTSKDGVVVRVRS